MVPYQDKSEPTFPSKSSPSKCRSPIHIQIVTEHIIFSHSRPNNYQANSDIPMVFHYHLNKYRANVLLPITVRWCKTQSQPHSTSPYLSRTVINVYTFCSIGRGFTTQQPRRPFYIFPLFCVFAVNFLDNISFSCITFTCFSTTTKHRPSRTN